MERLGGLEGLLLLLRLECVGCKAQGAPVSEKASGGTPDTLSG